MAVQGNQKISLLWNRIEFSAMIKQSSLKYLDFKVVYDDANIVTAIDTVMVFVNWPKKWDFPDTTINQHDITNCTQKYFF